MVNNKIDNPQRIPPLPNEYHLLSEIQHASQHTGDYTMVFASPKGDKFEIFSKERNGRYQTKASLFRGIRIMKLCGLFQEKHGKIDIVWSDGIILNTIQLDDIHITGIFENDVMSTKQVSLKALEILKTPVLLKFLIFPSSIWLTSLKKY